MSLNTSDWKYDVNTDLTINGLVCLALFPSLMNIIHFKSALLGKSKSIQLFVTPLPVYH